MKKFVAFAGFCLLAAGAFAQTNLQVFYDFGEDRKFVTSTLEMFKADDWGNTFFFVDYDHNWKNGKDKLIAPNSTYMEIARCWNFWGDTPLAPLSFQIEYNGGVGSYYYDVPGARVHEPYCIEKAWLFGVDYFLHSADFSNTLNLKALYKHWAENDGTPLQFTAVWGMQDIFGVSGLRFSGFVDFWGQKQSFAKVDHTYAETEWVLLSEPQLWYNIGSLFNCPNFNIGGEVEISNNFTQEGFMCNPCLGVKWDF